MEPDKAAKKCRFQIEVLEERIAPRHVDLPLTPATPQLGTGNLPGTSGNADAQSAAPLHNPHFSGKLRLLPGFGGDTVTLD